MTSTATSLRPAALSRPLVREAFIELVATAFLLIAVVRSGIMAERLCAGNVGLALLANAIATAGALVALILAFGPQSGAHMNPALTLAAAATEGLRWHAVPAYIAAQIVGAIAGVWLAHIMFDLPVWQLSQHAPRAPSMGRRGRSNVWSLDRDMGVSRTPRAGDGFRRRGVHHGRLLVHCFDIIRKPGGDGCSVAHRHLCRHPAG
jgi:hypothetical protein